MPIQIKNVFLKITSGAVANSIKHSGIPESEPIRIWINVTQEGEPIRLEVRDNGKGMGDEPKGYGITRMEQL